MAARARRLLWIPAAALLLACGGAAAPVAQPAQVAPLGAADPEGGAPAEPTPGGPAPILYLVDDGAGPGLAVFRVEPDGSGAHPLGLRVAAPLSGEIHMGTTTPVVSPDGLHLAYVSPDGRSVWLASTDGRSPRLVLTFEPAVLIAGFSPDSRRLLVRGWAPDGVGHLAGAPPGFHEHTLGGGTARRDDLAGFDAFTTEGDFLYVEDGPDDAVRLLRQSRHGGAPVPLATARRPDGFGQLARGETGRLAWLGDRAIWVAGPSAEEPSLLVRGAFAEFQWPTPSPDGAHVALLHRSGDRVALEVARPDGADRRELHPCGVRCFARWHDEGSLIVLGDEGLARVDLEGRVTPLARGGREIDWVGVGTGP